MEIVNKYAAILSALSTLTSAWLSGIVSNKDQMLVEQRSYCFLPIMVCCEVNLVSYPSTQASSFDSSWSRSHIVVDGVGMY